MIAGLSSIHPRRWWRWHQGGASGRGRAAGVRGIGGAASGAALHGRGRGGGPTWPEELGSAETERGRAMPAVAQDARLALSLT
jgi:hypothetical protein